MVLQVSLRTKGQGKIVAIRPNIAPSCCYAHMLLCTHDLLPYQLTRLSCMMTTAGAAAIVQFPNFSIASKYMNVLPERGAIGRKIYLLCAEDQYEPGSDEAFARQLQQQLDMEDDYPQQYHVVDQDAAAAPREAAAPHRTPATHVAQDLAQSLFAFDRLQEDEGGRGRGRGRGGRRGGRGRGRR